MTPTELAAIERRKKFHQHIAMKAAELELKKQTPATPSESDPSSEVGLFQKWMEQWRDHPSNQGWFSITEEKLRCPKISLIQRIICQYYEVSLPDLLSPRRTEKVVRPRQVGMFLCKEFTAKSLPEIGRRFGNRDHTTVLHAVRVIATRRASDPALAADIDMLRTEIRVAS